MKAPKTTPSTPSSKIKGLSRIEYGSSKGWLVRAYRNNATYSKLFSDTVYGGKIKAKKAAMAYKKELYSKVRTIEKTRSSRRIVHNNARNKSGILGVCRTKKRSASGNVHEYYSVSWRPSPNTQKCTTFSITKYGEKKALNLAIALRKEKLNEIIQNNNKASPLSTPSLQKPILTHKATNKKPTFSTLPTRKKVTKNS